MQTPSRVGCWAYTRAAGPYFKQAVGKDTSFGILAVTSSESVYFQNALSSQTRVLSVLPVWGQKNGIILVEIQRAEEMVRRNPTANLRG